MAMDETEAPIRTGWRAWWPFPGLVFALLAMSMTIVVVTITLASNDPSFGVEEDYYAKAIAWDQTAEQMRLNEELGWESTVEFSPELDPHGKRVVTVLIRDRQGQPISADAVHAFAFHHARRANPVEFDLVPIAPGRYSAAADVIRDGVWTVRLRVESNGTVFTSTNECWTTP